MAQERRRFNKTEKATLKRVARGKCEACGGPLGRDWEADHRYPYSKGGPTDVINGQALCKKCNRGKSDSVEEV